MRLQTWIVHTLAGGTLLLSALGAAGAGFIDVLDTPARLSNRASHSLINALARAGQRVVGVGQRGHIMYSDDQGKHWTQAKVPVSADLAAVSFPSARQGWAVGHDGVILHSADAGATWVRQLDGRALGALAGNHYARDTPFLDVWFEDEQRGFAVGAFNLILRTEDGGASWQPWMERTDNPKGLHLNAMRMVGQDLYIVGEQGLVLKRSSNGSRFVLVPTPYQGSYFGVTGKGGTVIVFGLRGNAYRSVDAGRSWEKIATGVQVGLTAAAILPDERMVLLSQAGQVLLSSDGADFTLLKHAVPGPSSAVVTGAAGELLLGGVRGMRIQALNKN